MSGGSTFDEQANKAGAHLVHCYKRTQPPPTGSPFTTAHTRHFYPSQYAAHCCNDKFLLLADPSMLEHARS
jgi:hypothetical protein